MVLVELEDAEWIGVFDGESDGADVWLFAAMGDEDFPSEAVGEGECMANWDGETEGL